MITEAALREAIAEVQGKRDPNRNDCMMLAAFYTIQDHLYPEHGYSTADGPTEKPLTIPSGDDTIGVYGDSIFLQKISTKSASDVWAIMDDLMENTLRYLNPRIYDGVLNALDEL